MLNIGKSNHIALQVEDVASAVTELVDCGVEMVDTEPRVSGDGTMIAFVHPRATSGMLVEFVEVASTVTTD